MFACLFQSLFSSRLSNPRSCGFTHGAECWTSLDAMQCSELRVSEERQEGQRRCRATSTRACDRPLLLWALGMDGPSQPPQSPFYKWANQGTLRLKSPSPHGTFRALEAGFEPRPSASTAGTLSHSSRRWELFITTRCWEAWVIISLKNLAFWNPKWQKSGPGMKERSTLPLVDW